MSVSHFKATCLSLLEKVRRTGKPLLITKRGRPLAQIVPAQPGKRPKSWVGSMAGTVEIKGDIVSPAFDLDEWEALRA